ncbi:MAG: hypothetical protein WAU28_03645 [Candidatus Moraniibacteriota bacterium]
MNFIFKHTLLAVTSLIIVVATIIMPSASVENSNALLRTPFGYPMTFLFQDLHLKEGFLFFPGHYKFSFDFQKYPLSGFSFVHFIADFLIIFGIIEAIVFILEKAKAFFANRNIWPYSKSI